jgi:hypothetical protein
METLVWTRGRAFPLSRMESRLRCPQCDSWQIVVLLEPPAKSLQQNVDSRLSFCAEIIRWEWKRLPLSAH